MNSCRFLAILFGILFYTILNGQQIRDPYSGPVFKETGAVYDVNNADFQFDSTQIFKAIFDIDRAVKKVDQPNPLIGSLLRYYNMHVRKGIPIENIHLAFVVHGKSTKHILNNVAYNKRYGVDNPNLPLIKALKKHGVQMYVCGQSANYSGILKEEISPDIDLALSAMTVLTIYQMNGYGMIRF